MPAKLVVMYMCVWGIDFVSLCVCGGGGGVWEGGVWTFYNKLIIETPILGWMSGETFTFHYGTNVMLVVTINDFIGLPTRTLSK